MYQLIVKSEVLFYLIFIVVVVVMTITLVALVAITCSELSKSLFNAFYGSNTVNWSKHTANLSQSDLKAVSND